MTARAADRFLGRLALLAPLRTRDFALLWTGMSVSLLGDGIYVVAIAWQVYALSDAPTALSVVGVAWVLPTVLLLLLGGAVSDRFERRRVLLVADATEAVAIGAIGVLSLAGVLQLWMLLVLVAIYGVGEAFFLPTFDAIVPTLIAQEHFASASSLDNFVRPLAVQFIGPALGGVLVAILAPGAAFLVDAGTFVVAALAILAMSRAPVIRAGATSLRHSLREIGDGFRFVRANPWLWATLLGASLSLLAYFGPFQVLLPYVVKNRLHSGGATFGAIRAGIGIGGIAAAAAVAQRGLPRRAITWMFVCWSLQSLVLAGYAAANGAWLLAVLSLANGAFSSVANIIWGTLMMTLVPDELRGRVSSFDWVVSIGLIPLSFAITGPIAEAIGAQTTLLCAGVIGPLTMSAFLLVPGVRDPERRLVTARAGGAGGPAAGAP